MATERTWDDLIEQNERQEYGEAWLPDKHPEQPRTLIGTVAGHNQGPESEWSGDRPWICTVVDRDGKNWSVWLNRAVLVSEFGARKPMPDERIVLRYRGQADKPSKPSMAPAQLYTLTVDRERQLPEFLARPRLEGGGQVGSDIPTDDRPLVDREFDARIADADVVEDKEHEKEGEADDLPF
jgi:hypothetical protein